MCFPCPPGTVYPYLVHIVIPSLSVDVLAANELDEDADGELVYLYRWEGVEDGYDSQSYFELCAWSVSIRPVGGDIICSGSVAPGLARLIAISCPPDPLVLLYEVECDEGGILEVYIME